MAMGSVWTGRRLMIMTLVLLLLILNPNRLLLTFKLVNAACRSGPCSVSKKGRFRSKKWTEMKRNETKRNELQRNELSLFRFVSVRCSSVRFVSFRRSALTCARTELQRTATNRFWTVLGRRDPVLSTNQSRAECRFAENSRRIIQFRRILETAMCRLPYLTHSRDYNYRRKCFIETQI